jgi:hypothetical protein
MKKLNKIILPLLVIFTIFINSSCDPFNELYLTLSVDLEFSTGGMASNIIIPAQVSLSNFENYDDNRDNIDEITYISSAYITLQATEGLKGDDLKLTLYQDDRSIMLFQYTQDHFTFADFENKPLEIILTDQEKNNINNYLKNPQEDKGFYATFELSNITYSGPSQSYFLDGKMEFLTQLKVKP